MIEEGSITTVSCHSKTEALGVREDRKLDVADRACDLDFFHVDALRAPRLGRLQLRLCLCQGDLRKTECGQSSYTKRNENTFSTHQLSSQPNP
jgi:hypothetical protein